jgi:hypothetical protein
MALATYADLQSAIAGWLLRSDLTARIPDFISLAEAQIARDVRHWRMESRASVSLQLRYTVLPTDWVDTIRATLSVSTGKALKLASMTEMDALRAANGDAVGQPRYYAHVAGSLEVYPTPDTTYTLEIYYTQKVPALSDSNTTNWLLTDSPDVYLYGSLIQSAPFLVEDARLAVWAGLYRDAVDRLNNASKAARWSGSGITFGRPRT